MSSTGLMQFTCEDEEEPNRLDTALITPAAARTAISRTVPTAAPSFAIIRHRQKGATLEAASGPAQVATTASPWLKRQDAGRSAAHREMRPVRRAAFERQPDRVGGTRQGARF